MAVIRLNKSTVLFKGMKGNMTNTQSRLFWVTKNIKSANFYSKSREGVTHAYRPARPLKLLKFSRENIRRLLMSNAFSPNTKKRIELMFGIGMTYGNQYRGLLALNRRWWGAHFSEKFQKMVPIWKQYYGMNKSNVLMGQGGRISVTNSNYKLFANIRNAIQHQYDGIYVPTMRTPHYNEGSFSAEYILFNPRRDLVNVTNEFNFNMARENLNKTLVAMNNRREARRIRSSVGN
jgi:uncharacterized FAD-dependent dehydrogenase